MTCRPVFCLFAATVAVSSAFVAISDSVCRAADIGSPAPVWNDVPGTDDKLHSLSDHSDAKVIVVAFLCNKCPCVKGYEARFNRFAEKYGSQGVRFVAFNSSLGDLENMATMKQRASGGKLRFDYLRDASQQVGRAFGATSTPHIFILDQNRNVVYTGSFDDNRSEAVVKNHYVIDAVDALLAGKPVPVAKTRQFGCAIGYQ
ncbi:MAG: thioredoxin family protein [Planctomycetaceae bacterium]